jgi:hypothetical protein
VLFPDYKSDFLLQKFVLCFLVFHFITPDEHMHVVMPYHMVCLIFPGCFFSRLSTMMTLGFQTYSRTMNVIMSNVVDDIAVFTRVSYYRESIKQSNFKV